MMDFEDRLRRTLAREDPSPDFAARVVARAMVLKRPVPWAGWRPWAAAGVAASFLLGGLGVDFEQRQKQQGEAARAQLIQAMHITSTKLQRIQKRVQGERQ